MSEDDRCNRAMALMCSAISWKGNPVDVGGMLSLADEYLAFIEGKESEEPFLPLHDLFKRAK